METKRGRGGRLCIASGNELWLYREPHREKGRDRAREGHGERDTQTKGK